MARDIVYGAVYLIDEDPDFARHLEGMQQNGLNTVMLWPMIHWDVKTRTPDFTRVDRFIDLAHQHGLQVVPELIGEAFWLEYAPNWLVARDSSLLATDVDTKNAPDLPMNLNHPAVRRMIEEYLTLVVNRYKDHPALLAWNVWDEPYFSSSDDYTVEKYRQWLREKYGDITALNEVWARTFSDWKEVAPSQAVWASMAPVVDGELFRFANTAEILQWLAGIVKGLDPRHPILAHGIMGTIVNEELFVDDWKMAQHVDIYGCSFYGFDDLGVNAPWYHACLFDGLRCAAGEKPFMLAEAQTGPRSGHSLSGHMNGDDIYLLSWQTLARGGKGILFWKWIPFLRGAQMFGRGLCLADGSFTDKNEAVSRFSSVLRRHGDVLAGSKPEKPEIAIAYDLGNQVRWLEHFESRLAPDHFLKGCLLANVVGYYRMLWEENIPVDFLRSEELGSRIGDYRVVIFPSQMILSMENAEAVKQYVSGGGAVIADARFAGMDEKDTGYFVHPGAGLDEVFGVRERGFVSGQESVGFGIEKSCQGILRERSASGTMFREHLEPFDGSEVIGRYRDDGGPAIVMNGYGRGKTVYVGTLLGAHYYKSGARGARNVVLGMLEGLLGYYPRVALSGPRDATVECVVHAYEGTRVIYVINHRAHRVECTLSVPVADERTRHLDIVRDKVIVPRIAGDRLRFPIRLGGKEVMVIRETFEP